MSNELNKLETKVDQIDSKLDVLVREQVKHTVILQQNHNNWVEHMKRTKTNEIAITDLRTEQTEFRSYIKAFHRVSAAIIGTLLSVAAILVTLFGD